MPAARGNAVGFSTSADWGASDAFAAPGGFGGGGLGGIAEAAPPPPAAAPSLDPLPEDAWKAAVKWDDAEDGAAADDGDGFGGPKFSIEIKQAPAACGSGLGAATAALTLGGGAALSGGSRPRRLGGSPTDGRPALPPDPMADSSASAAAAAEEEEDRRATCSAPLRRLAAARRRSPRRCSPARRAAPADGGRAHAADGRRGVAAATAAARRRCRRSDLSPRRAAAPPAPDGFAGLGIQDMLAGQRRGAFARSALHTPERFFLKEDFGQFHGAQPRHPNPAHATIEKLLSPPVDVLLRPEGGWKRPHDLLGALAEKIATNKGERGAWEEPRIADPEKAEVIGKINVALKDAANAWLQTKPAPDDEDGARKFSSVAREAGRQEAAA